MSHASSRRVGYLAWAVAIAIAGCCHRPPAVIHMAWPHDRYDHNRAQLIVSPALHEGHPTSVTDEVYTPAGRLGFPPVALASGSPSPDGVPVAGLVPIFTGVPLPLSSEGKPSDRADLIDFLAEGPDAQRGVERGDMQGGTKETERQFKALLDLLASPSQLGGGAQTIQRWAAARGITSTQAVVDSRYRPSAFADRIAVYCDHFWFVLYQLPKQDHFTRLVVVPVHTTRQDFEAKRPVGKDGRCGDAQ